LVFLLSTYFRTGSREESRFIRKNYGMRGGLTQLGRPLKGKSLTESQEGLPGLDPRGGKDRKGKRRRQAGGGKAGSGLSGRRSKSYPLRKGFPCIFYLLCPLFCGLEKRERATCPA